MATFEAWDVIKVPFPYTDRPVRQMRPALVVASSELAARHGLLWVMMITSAANRGWLSDVDLPDLDGTGLPAPSVVRTAKIATIETSDALRIGSVSGAVQAAVTRQLAVHVQDATSASAGPIGG